ncbi:cupin domain-containing protein [Planosporangium thailandense]|uniref:cupin domain-containing protein n=1 Tax=Planosporangium thailandense TaxID=765197 RepID=UPI00197C8CCD
MVSADTVPQREWGDGCAAWPLADTPALLVVEERMPPGTAEVPHRHVRATQTFYVLAGTLTMQIAGVAYTVSARQCITVPAGVAHQARNDTDGPVEFLVIASPPTTGDRVDLP